MSMTLLCVLLLLLTVQAKRGLNREDDSDSTNGTLYRRAAAVEANAAIGKMVASLNNNIGSVARIRPPIDWPIPVRPTDALTRCLANIDRKRGLSFQAHEKRQLKKFANRDFVFILDTSGSMLGSEFNLAKESIASLLEAFCPVDFGYEKTDKGTKQMAMVLFGSTVDKVIDFEDSHYGMRHMQELIMGAKHRRESNTATPAALKYVRENILGKGLSRLNDPQVSTDVIIVTDGRCNMGCTGLEREADALRRMGHGVNVFAIGVGDARECELDILSGKQSEFSFDIGSMGNFRLAALQVTDGARGLPERCV